MGAELRAGRMAWITEGDREVTTAHCVSPWWAERDWGRKFVLLALRSFMKEMFLYCSYGIHVRTFEMLPTSTPAETAEYHHCLLLLTDEQLIWWSLKASFSFKGIQ